MYVLFYKEPHIVKTESLKNRTCQTWRGKQIAMCNERQPLQNMIDQSKRKDLYYIEKSPGRKLHSEEDET